MKIFKKIWYLCEKLGRLLVECVKILKNVQSMFRKFRNGESEKKQKKVYLMENFNIKINRIFLILVEEKFSLITKAHNLRLKVMEQWLTHSMQYVYHGDWRFVKRTDIHTLSDKEAGIRNYNYFLFTDWWTKMQKDN